jgi:competence protein ComFB
MDIHNATEDIVLRKVHKTFDEEEGSKKVGYCTCDQCRLDVACYVLNRTVAEYVVSSRGLAYIETDRAKEIQRDVDLMRLIYEGIKQVNTAKRPHFVHAGSHEKSTPPHGPIFNYPTIMGRVFNGRNFEPIGGTSLTLLHGGELVRMVDPNWQNPCALVQSTAGRYAFWPASEPAESAAATKIVEFEIVGEASGFEKFRYTFSMTLNAESEPATVFSMQRTIKLADQFMFPKE